MALAGWELLGGLPGGWGVVSGMEAHVRSPGQPGVKGGCQLGREVFMFTPSSCSLLGRPRREMHPEKVHWE